MKLIPRLSHERGHADNGWLKTFYTFSFASYRGSGHEQFGSLRVLNEDWVEPRTGFGMHGHKESEIISYIIDGEVEQEDSMGNAEITRRGDIQLTSAGTGITHSEKVYGSKAVHVLQIWSLPSISGLTPNYFTRHFTDDEKKDRWVRVVAPVGAEGVIHQREASGPAPVQSPLTLFATLISPSTTLSHTFLGGSTQERKGYIHVVQSSGYNDKEATGARLRVRGEDGVELELREGDGAYIFAEPGKMVTVENIGDIVSEVLLFDLE